MLGSYKGVNFAVLNGTEHYGGIRCLFALMSDERERQ
jgi:hypothetical protein